ncbi:LysE family translocator [Joostella sp. CR20]|uniref:LysE family translocator n=1 Tax=Joostella sp. CR20 TaxID=2804312 RepID=UPI00313BD411
MDIQILIAFTIASVVLALTPGPDNIYVLTQSMANGVKNGLITVLGLISGCLVHTTLVAFGVATFIIENQILFTSLKVFGALYLLYLAYSVYKSDSEIQFETSTASQKSTLGFYLQGFLMNLLNPKVLIFFLAFFPGFLFSDTMPVIAQFYTLGSIFCLITFLIFSLIALLAGRISVFVKESAKVGVFFKWLQVVVFVLLAVIIFV